MKNYNFKGALKMSYIDPEILKDSENLPRVSIWDQIHENEESLVIKVLRAYLGREPKIEDAARIQVLKKVGIYDKYLIACDGTTLGAIKTVFNPPSLSKDPITVTSSVEITFDPKDKTL